MSLGTTALIKVQFDIHTCPFLTELSFTGTLEVDTDFLVSIDQGSGDWKTTSTTKSRVFRLWDSFEGKHSKTSPF